MFILISIPLFRLFNPVFPQTNPPFAEFNRVSRSLQVSKFSQIREIYWTIWILNINEILNSYLKPAIKNE